MPAAERQLISILAPEVRATVSVRWAFDCRENRVWHSAGVLSGETPVPWMSSALLPSRAAPAPRSTLFGRTSSTLKLHINKFHRPERFGSLVRARARVRVWNGVLYVLPKTIAGRFHWS
jgi:hypothetical protein